jgi:hypothetical protein
LEHKNIKKVQELTNYSYDEIVNILNTYYYGLIIDDDIILRNGKRIKKN